VTHIYTFDIIEELLAGNDWWQERRM